MLGLLFFIISLVIIILVHELGHLIAAKKFGVFCHEFAIGMGPKICQLYQDKTGTVYNLRLIPLGGFVQIAGQDYDVSDDDGLAPSQLMYNKPTYQKIIILLAGTLSNCLLGLVFLEILSLCNLTPNVMNFMVGSDINTRLFGGFYNFYLLMLLMFKSIYILLSGGINQMSGIIGIYQSASYMVDYGVGYMLYFIAFLSINIGIVNQLPIPMLDGGRIVICLYEALFKKHVSQKAYNILMYLSLIILLLLFVYTGVLDIKRLFN